MPGSPSRGERGRVLLLAVVVVMSLLVVATARCGASTRKPTTTVKLTWKTPRDKATIAGRAVRLKVSASRVRRIARVVFTVDRRRIATDRRAPYQARFNTRRVANGRHVVRATAMLRNGKRVSRRIRIAVKNAPAPRPVPSGPATTASTPLLPLPPLPAIPPISPTPPPAPPPDPVPLPLGASLVTGCDFDAAPSQSYSNQTIPSCDGWVAEANPGRLTVQGDPAGGANKIAFFERRDGDADVANGARSEASGPTQPLGTFFYTGDFLIPSGSALPSSSAWRSVWQVHSVGASPSGSPLQLFVVALSSGKFKVSLRNGFSTKFYWESGALDFDTKYRFGFWVKWTTDSSGWLEGWFGGGNHPNAHFGRLTGLNTLGGGTGQGGQVVYPKGGIHSSPGHKGTRLQISDSFRVYSTP